MHRTTVVNLKGHRDDPAYADVVYVGRAMNRGGWHLKGSPLASPFRPGPDGTREEVVEKYRAYLLGRPDLPRPPPRTARAPARMLVRSRALPRAGDR